MWLGGPPSLELGHHPGSEGLHAACIAASAEDVVIQWVAAAALRFGRQQESAILQRIEKNGPNFNFLGCKAWNTRPATTAYWQGSRVLLVLANHTGPEDCAHFRSNKAACVRPDAHGHKHVKKYPYRSTLYNTLTAVLTNSSKNPTMQRKLRHLFPRTSLACSRRVSTCKTNSSGRW